MESDLSQPSGRPVPRTHRPRLRGRAGWGCDWRRPV